MEVKHRHEITVISFSLDSQQCKTGTFNAFNSMMGKKIHIFLIFARK